MIPLPVGENVISVGIFPTKSIIIRAILIYCGKFQHSLDYHSIKYFYAVLLLIHSFYFL